MLTLVIEAFRIRLAFSAICICRASMSLFGRIRLKILRVVYYLAATSVSNYVKVHFTSVSGFLACFLLGKKKKREIDENLSLGFCHTFVFQSFQICLWKTLIPGFLDGKWFFLLPMFQLPARVKRKKESNVLPKPFPPTHAPFSHTLSRNIYTPK